MADKKISALTASTTPLAGTEVLPIVQSGSTVKVAVSDLTAGRIVSGSSFTGTNTIGFQMTAASDQDLRFALPGVVDWRVRGNYASGNMDFVAVGYSSPLTLRYGGDVAVNTGNLVVSTSGKGIDFSATPGTGTSELFADYEEGTWTPNQGGGLIVVGAFSSSGTYTKVGRQVTVSGVVTGATSINTSGSGIVCTNLPFAIATSVPVGAMTNTATNNSNVYGNPSTSTMYSSTATGVSGSLYFTLTYITS